MKTHTTTPDFPACSRKLTRTTGASGERQFRLAKIARSCRLVSLLGLGLLFSITEMAGSANSTPTMERIQTNSNQTPAGTLAGGVLKLLLDVREGDWFPENENGPSLKVFALAERGKAPQIPGPMIRIPEGTIIQAEIRNLLPVAVVMHGLHSHPGDANDVLEIPAGGSREFTFQVGSPGAYYYWATAGGDTLGGRPYKEDSQLSGAFIVDQAGSVLADRIFVIGAWRDRQRPEESFDIPVINGKSWPYTERMEYVAGSDVRWRWLNASAQLHPMHMHGSYFRVDAIGDSEREAILPAAQRKSVVTQLIPVGGTMSMYWHPEEPGRWLFHCHILTHVSPDTMMLRQHSRTEHVIMSRDDPIHDMAGLVMGITVLPKPGEPIHRKVTEPKRRLVLVITDQQGGKNPRGYNLSETGKMKRPASAPGPALVLTQGVPVAIHVTNRLKEPTSVHWHGIELQSYYDGVPGWTGFGDQVTPMIFPNKSFDVFFTPPRAGTFIYHTHMNDMQQLSSGLYGPIIVLPRGEVFDPETDRVFLISRNGMRKDGELLLNGMSAPQLQVWHVGVPYRLRFININANNTIIVNFNQNGKPVMWKSVAKDGADLPTEQVAAGPASFLIAPGETYDFELRPERVADMELTLDLLLLKEKLTQSIRVESSPLR